jgi:hypothetical protein
MYTPFHAPAFFNLGREVKAIVERDIDMLRLSPALRGTEPNA